MKEKFRVIHVINVRWFNATAWYGLYLARLMKEAGHDVIVLGLKGTDSFLHAERMGLNPIALPLNTQNPFTFITLCHSLGTLLREFSPHVVNCHRGENFPLWAYLKRKHNFCLVRTRGDQRLPKGGIFNRYLHNNSSDAIITTNSAATHAVHTILGTPLSKITTIIGGVDRERFHYSVEGRERFRALLGLPTSAFVLGILGRFDHVKGQKELIKAFAEAKRKLPQGIDIRLLLAGFSTEVSDEDVRGWIHEAGIENSALITGKCEDVSACISAMDAGVVASLGSEAIARAALEIMSTGVPLISTRIGVMPDLLPAWAMVTPGNAQELVEIICKVAQDPVWQNQLREQCLARISQLSGQDFLEQTIGVYQKAIQDVPA